MILGAILAGGSSRRFGSDKALALLDGVAMIDLVAADLSTAVDKVVVCGTARGASTALPDRPRMGLGPLGGLCAALHYAKRKGFEAVLSAPCDTPCLDRSQLADLASLNGSAYLADLPLIGRWSVELSPHLNRYLKSATDRSVTDWAIVAGARALSWQTPANVNTPDDLARLSNG